MHILQLYIPVMPLTAPRLLFLLLFISTLYTHAQNRRPQLQKEPIWATSNSAPFTGVQLDAEGEDGVVDLVFEKQVSLETESVFTKRMIKLLSEAGVQSSSEISISYDPAFQQLIFHKINLIRNGRVIDKLQLSKVKTVQQEKDLSNFIYNGSLTAVLFLEDVQKEDILEYSYTLKGFNPIFGGKYSSIFDTRFSVPVYRIYYKLIVPNERLITVKNSKTDIAPTLSATAGGKIYEWHITNVPALRAEDNLPSWFDPYPMIMISEFQSWKEVSKWAGALFPFNVPLTKLLKSKVQELRLISDDPKSRVQAALRFVQDDIRYLGIEMGENSHKPHRPDLILQQRFGDCKDKSYLLCTLLQALGIEARPVLINSSYKQTINEWLPAPTVFDHVTVQVKLNGKYYWFDPTISFQRGPLEKISFPDYSTGLVITDTTTRLSAIPAQFKGRVKIKEIFNISDLNDRVQLKVVTDYCGSSADDTRSDFKNTSNYELRKNYRNYYAPYFKNITADSLTASDNEKTGVFTTTEYYTLDSIWGTSAFMKKASFEPYVINGIMKKPDAVTRTMPFSLRYPAHYTEEIEINLPEVWSLKQSRHSNETSAFKLTADYSSTGKRMVLKYDFESLKDHITPDEVADYLRQLNKAEEGIAYTLTSTATEDDSPYVTTSTNNYTFLYLALGVCAFTTYTIRKRNKA